MRALEAVEKLRRYQRGRTRYATIKPLDEKRLLSRRRSPVAMTAENHTGRRVREAVAALPMRKGVRCLLPLVSPDEFLLAGAPPTLHDRYGTPPR